MSNTNPNQDPVNPVQTSTPQVEYYEIHVKGLLIPCWSERFEGLTATILENNEIILSGPVTDQAALYGLITRIRDLNLELIHIKNVTRHS